MVISPRQGGAPDRGVSERDIMVERKSRETRPLFDHILTKNCS